MRKLIHLPRSIWAVLLVAGLGVLAARCSSSPATCDATSCATGCCDAYATCRTGDSDAVCGKGGASCSACSGAQTCVAQVCTAGSNTDSGTDAGAPDAGTRDSGTPDSGAVDAGAPDAGRQDSGAADSGFQSLAPCLTPAMYTTTGTTITFPNGAFPNFSYAPNCLTVRAGTTVTWSSPGPFSSHPLAPSGRGTQPNPIPPTSGAGSMATALFPNPGFYPYYCTFHGTDAGTGSMAGVVQVIP